MSQSETSVVLHSFQYGDVARLAFLANNIASQKVLLKNGFKQEAIFEKAVFKNEQLIDEVRFAKVQI